jgi:predicted acetyltransferase
MTMSPTDKGRVRVEPAGAEDRERIANLMQLYLHDLSEYEDGPLNAQGLFDLGDHFDLYWIEGGRHPFLISTNDQLVGFALVREITDGVFSMAEFFVRRGYRGSCIGRTAATTLFDRFRGTWTVAELERNTPAQAFWRRVIGDYTDGRFSEAWSDAEPSGPMQVFSHQGER